MQNILLTKLIEAARNINVLYVEDDEFIRAQMTNLLSDIFKNLKVAKNGKDALSILLVTNADIMITDIVMPIMDGLELIQSIRAKNINPKIIVISAIEDTDMQRLDELQVNAFVPKPIEPSVLFATLLSICEGEL
jgi:two-component system, OmpR family, response regulator VanR